MNDIEHFEIERFMRWLFIAIPFLLVTVTLLGLAQPFLPNDGRPCNESFTNGFSIVFTVFFGGTAWYSWRMVLKLPQSSISIDHDGIWQSIYSRNTALVPWQKISHVRERSVLQRLDLLDDKGSVLLQIEYQLANFERLRHLVLTRSALSEPIGIVGGAFAKPFVYHVFNVCTLAAFIALGLYVWPFRPFLSVAVLVTVVGMAASEYLRTVYKIEIKQDRLLIYFPGRCQSLRKEEIQAVELNDLLVKYARHAQVSLRVVGMLKPINLRNLGTPAIDLHRALIAWRSNVTQA